jgi:hypothetical protein
MIPSSYVTVAYFTTLLGGYFFRTQGEGGMVFLYIWAQLIVTFTSVAVINLILFLMFQNQDNKS